MNKFFLTFKSPEFEQKYQSSQLQQIRYNLYLGMIFGCLFMNLFIVISYFISPSTIIWQINAAFAIFSIFQIIVFLVMKNLKYIQIAMTITNIMIALLELTLDPQSVTQTEFFSYGNTFMQFQAIIYLISDFQYSIIQLIGQLVARQVITIVISDQFNVILFGTQLIAVGLIAIATYMRNKSGRLFFMQNLKDNYFDQISSFLIVEPYFKITLRAEDLMFHVTQNKEVRKFPGYEDDYCTGCNVRKLLRKYKLETGKDLESYLLNEDYIALPATIPIYYKKKKYLLRICKIDFIEKSYLIILEQDCQKDAPENPKEEKQLKVFLKKNKSLHQKFMSWGILSVVLLKSKVLQNVDFQFTLERFLKIYKKQIWKKIKVTIISYSKEKELFTFSHQLQIFLIQMFDSIMLIQQQKKVNTTIGIMSEVNQIQMNVENNFSNSLMENLSANYFFQKTSKLLVNNIEIQPNSIQFSFKKYSKKTFLYPNF